MAEEKRLPRRPSAGVLPLTDGLRHHHVLQRKEPAAPSDLQKRKGRHRQNAGTAQAAQSVLALARSQELVAAAQSDGGDGAAGTDWRWREPVDPALQSGRGTVGV